MRLTVYLRKCMKIEPVRREQSAKFCDVVQQVPKRTDRTGTADNKP